MAKEIVFHAQARERCLAGINAVADTVKLTMGPRGRNVLLEKSGGEPPLVTNDGVTIAKEISLAGSMENMGAQVLREAAGKTNELAGDGTTTAIVLAQAILQESFQNIAAGANPILLRRGIQGASEQALAAVRGMAAPVHTHAEIARVAALSSQDEEIGRDIADALTAVGEEGVVNLEEAGGVKTTLEITEGIVLDKGFLSPYMATDKAGLTAELEEPYLLITDHKLNSVPELLPVLEQVAEQGAPLLIIAEEVGPQVLRLIQQNQREGDMEIVAIHPPAYGEGRRWRMEDLAVQTGGVFITETLGLWLPEVTLDMLGMAGKVVVKKQSTVILDGYGEPEAIRERENQLRGLIRNTDYDFNRKRYEERLAGFVSGVAVIRVGAYTELEMKEKKLRMEDSLNAARAAIREGVVAGGGKALLNASFAVQAYAETLSGEERLGAHILKKALERPAFQIAENAGYPGAMIVETLKTKPQNVGFDALSGEYVDLPGHGIMDPLTVTAGALQSAVSVAATLLTSEAGVAGGGKTDEAQ